MTIEMKRALALIGSGTLVLATTVGCGLFGGDEEEGQEEGEQQEQAASAGASLSFDASPTEARRVTGTLADGTRASERFGPTCRGHVPSEAQHTFEVGSEAELRIVSRSDRDGVMVITGADGFQICNDDFDGLNPGFQRVFAPGTYSIYLGPYSSFGEEEAAATYNLSFEPPVAGAAGSDTPDLAEAMRQLEQLGGDAGGELGAQLAEALGQLQGMQQGGGTAAPTPVNTSAAPREGTVARNGGSGQAPLTRAVQAGGNASASATNSECRGNVNPAGPNVAIDYTPGGNQPLVIAAESPTDTTLVVRAPDGTFHCNDDSNGFNPQVTFATPQAGQYQVWVGVYWGTELSEATLRIGEQ